ncbi:MAG: hypothetical protein EGP73_07425 [Alistipes indistinctus]|nr:hypothetical protein [Alistipes indistinctus]
MLCDKSDFFFSLSGSRQFSLLLSKITFRGHIPKNQDIENLRADEKKVDPGENQIPIFVFTFVVRFVGIGELSLYLAKIR